MTNLETISHIESNEENLIPTDLKVCSKMISLNHSAKSRGIEFDLSFKTVKKLLSQKTCFYTKERFSTDVLKRRTIDRIDASKGYIEGNVVACTHDMNQKKANLTVAEILSMAKSIEAHLSMINKPKKK